tara:strand:- start:744 stop:920 length:177 start_codon:yes stop_codon:yes gene_type:complete
MIRTYNDKLIKIDSTKYNKDSDYYKSLWLLKYNITDFKETPKCVKNKLKALIGKKKIL